jgi:hypothetical protein
MFMLNDKPLPLDTPFEIDGTQYPANWLRLTSIEEKNAVGITEVEDTQVTYDDRFYWGVDNPKDLAMLKTTWATQFKQQANAMLAPTDWTIVRKFERNVELPIKVAIFRSAVVTECSRLETAISNVSTVEDLVDVVNGQNWPTNE